MDAVIRDHLVGGKPVTNLIVPGKTVGRKFLELYGDVAFFNGHVLHSSKKNWTTDRFRRSFVGHYCNARSFTQWGFAGSGDIFMVTENLQPRPQFVAHAVMADALADARFAGDRSQEGVSIFAWRHGDGPLCAISTHANSLRVVWFRGIQARRWQGFSGSLLRAGRRRVADILHDSH